MGKKNPKLRKYLIDISAVLAFMQGSVSFRHSQQSDQEKMKKRGGFFFPSSCYPCSYLVIVFPDSWLPFWLLATRSSDPVRILCKKVSKQVSE